MTRKKELFGTLIIALICIPVLIYLVRPYSNILLIFFPPSDLYKPLIIEPITLKNKKILFQLPIKHDYVGSYLVGVYVENIPASFSIPIKTNAALNLKIISDDKIIFEKKYTDWSLVMGAPGKVESGVILDSYQVPEHIPMKLNLKAQLSVVSPDPTFEHRYGKAEFFIRRFLNQ